MVKKEDYKTILNKIYAFLEKNEFHLLKKNVSETLEKLSRSEFEQLKHDLNSDYWWGSAGSISDIQIDDLIEQREFEMNLHNLLHLLGEKNLISKNAKSAHKYLKKRMSKNAVIYKS
jgi:hypothetical protein